MHSAQTLPGKSNECFFLATSTDYYIISLKRFPGISVLPKCPLEDEHAKKKEEEEEEERICLREKFEPFGRKRTLPQPLPPPPLSPPSPTLVLNPPLPTTIGVPSMIQIPPDIDIEKLKEIMMKSFQQNPSMAPTATPAAPIVIPPTPVKRKVRETDDSTETETE